MRSAHNKLLKVLSAIVMATLFLCHVIGSLCPVAPPALVTAAAIHATHAGHAMETGSMCADALPASSKTCDSVATHTPLVLQPVSPDMTQAGLSVPILTGPSSARAGLSLLARLSTFRI